MTEVDPSVGFDVGELRQMQWQENAMKADIIEATEYASQCYGGVETVADYIVKSNETLKLARDALVVFTEAYDRALKTRNVPQQESLLLDCSRYQTLLDGFLQEELSGKIDAVRCGWRAGVVPRILFDPANNQYFTFEDVDLPQFRFPQVKNRHRAITPGIYVPVAGDYTKTAPYRPEITLGKAKRLGRMATLQDRVEAFAMPGDRTGSTREKPTSEPYTFEGLQKIHSVVERAQVPVDQL